MDPFAIETIKLRVPLTLGERTVTELHIKPPKVRDIVRTDGNEPTSVAYARALLSSLTGEPESILNEMVPEDWADCLVILAKTAMRFSGTLNLLDQKEEKKNPTNRAEKANTPPGTSEMTSAALPEN
jgi:hypothetical protein